MFCAALRANYSSRISHVAGRALIRARTRGFNYVISTLLAPAIKAVQISQTCALHARWSSHGESTTENTLSLSLQIFERAWINPDIAEGVKSRRRIPAISIRALKKESRREIKSTRSSVRHEALASYSTRICLRWGDARRERTGSSGIIKNAATNLA